MPRVKRSVHARKKRRKVLEEAKGYWGLKSKTYTHAKEQVEHSLIYAYRDRKVRKRTMRSLWIIRINAAARQHGLSYNQFVAGCKKAEIELDRKVLADLAVSDPAAFGAIAEQAKAALAAYRQPSRSAPPKAGQTLRAACARDHLGREPAPEADPQAREPAAAGEARAVRLRGRGSRRRGARAPGSSRTTCSSPARTSSRSCSPGSRRSRTRRG